MNLSHFLAVLRARWIAALAGFLVVVAAVAAYLILATRVYEANAELLIDVTPDPVSSLMYGGASPSMINTQLEILRSDRVAQRVVQNLKLADLSDMREAWASAKSGMSIQDWLVAFVENGLDAKVAAAGTNVISVGYRSADARFAATAANAYVQAYLETSIELRVDPAKQYSGFFTDQQKSARDTLEAAQNKLSAYQKEKGIIGSDDHLDLELNRLSMLQQELVTMQTANVQASTRQAQVGKSPNELSEVLSNSNVAGLKAELATAELKLQDLSARYGDRHPQVQDARADVAALRAERHPNPDLPRAAADRERHHRVEADGREKQRDEAEDHEHRAEHAHEPQRLRDRILERGDPVEWNVRVERCHHVANRGRDRHRRAVRLRRDIDESASLLRERPEHGRRHRLFLIAAEHVGHDADDGQPWRGALLPAEANALADGVALEVLRGERTVHQHDGQRSVPVSFRKSSSRHDRRAERREELRRDVQQTRAGVVSILQVALPFDGEVAVVEAGARAGKPAAQRRRLHARE